MKSLAEEIAEVARTGVQIGLVVGGGNFFRGVSAAAMKMDRVAADHMGMLATVINALALQDALEKTGVPTRVMTAIQIHQVAEPYIRRRAIRHLEKGRIVDIRGRNFQSLFFHRHRRHSARARDPRRCHRQRHARQRRLRQGSAAARRCRAVPGDQLSRRAGESLKVLDASAVAMCRDNQLPILVFNLNVFGNIMRMSMGEPIGTLIH